MPPVLSTLVLSATGQDAVEAAVFVDLAVGPVEMDTPLPSRPFLSDAYRYTTVYVIGLRYAYDDLRTCASAGVNVVAISSDLRYMGSVWDDIGKGDVPDAFIDVEDVDGVGSLVIVCDAHATLLDIVDGYLDDPVGAGR